MRATCCARRSPCGSCSSASPLGYFLSAWAKARGNTWNDGTAIALSLRIEDLQRYVAPEWLFEQAVLLNLFTWATLLFEATFGILVWNRRLRPWVLGTGIAFHLGIDIFLDIGFFSIAIFLAYLAFVPDEAANKLVGRFDASPASPSRAALDEPEGARGTSSSAQTAASDDDQLAAGDRRGL